MPLMKGVYMRLCVNLNTNAYISLTTNATPAYSTAYSVTTSNNGTLPFQLSALGTTGIQCTAVAQTMVASIGICKSFGPVASASHAMQQCRLYAPAYKLTGKGEEYYLKELPSKQIYWRDFYSYPSNATGIIPGNPVNLTLGATVPRVRGVLIIPQLSYLVHGGAVATLNTTGGATLGSTLLSPFSSSPGTCGPWSRISNFNVSVNGTQIYQTNQTYGFEQFLNEVRKSNLCYGNMMSEISAGLIGQSDWEAGYGFIYTNLERCANSAQDNVFKQISISFNNASNYTCDYYIFLIYERSAEISTTTGNLIIS
jgi:hypothetical protein